MSKTKIEWCDATWNPVRGCTKVSEGCRHCYAATFAERFRGVPGHPYEHGFDVRVVPEKLTEPLGWRKLRRVFLNSMSDLFHPDVPDEFIDRVFAVMALCPQHTFIVLTKRPERMHDYVTPGRRQIDVMNAAIAIDLAAAGTIGTWPLPLPNVWLGVSCEDQETADARIPILLQTPAAVRFVSLEPLLGPVDLASIEWPGKGGHRVDVLRGGYWCEKNWRGLGPAAALGAPRGGFTNHSDMNRVGWVIVGAESGPKARPMPEDCVRAIRDQCQAAGVPLFYKQRIVGGRKVSMPELDGRQWAQWPEARTS